MPAKRDLIGSTINGFIFLRELSERTSSRKIQYECICPSCQQTCIVVGNNVLNGNTTQCQTCKYLKAKKHGMSDEKIYSVWAAMKWRCNSPNTEYNNRGIDYSKDWEQFEDFLKDMGCSYVEGLSLERIDNDGNYCKDNCKWATNQEQILNRRKPKGNTASKFRYISKTSKNRWRACLTLGYKQIYTEYFDSEHEAVEAVNKFITDNNLPHILN